MTTNRKRFSFFFSCSGIPISDDEKSLKDEDEKSDKEEEDAESLEEGEVSDEDEESRKERLKPQPVCRFYSKGQCTWGASCRFVHPGVLDKGNYNMFAPPRPILPGNFKGKAIKSFFLIIDYDSSSGTRSNRKGH